MRKICSIEKCNNVVHCKDLCDKHYRRFRLYGDPLYTQNERHGMSLSTEYFSWRAMKARCNNPKKDGYHRYGGRGIKVCSEWKESFTCFLKDMGFKPFPKAEIDRRNNDGDYCSDNCYWTTRAVNGQHTRTTVLTAEVVAEMRQLHKTGNISYRELGRIYGIKEATVLAAVKKITWKQNVNSRGK